MEPERKIQTVGRFSVALVLIALLLSACGASQDAAQTGGSGSDHSGHGGASATSATEMSFDLMFISSMSAHHESAIEMAEVALEKAEHPEIKQLAQEIIKAQKAENERMAGWGQEWYDGKVPEMDHSAMEGMKMEGAMGVSAEELEKAKPFDKAFIDAMIPHHEAAIVDAKQALEKAEHPELKDMAKDIIRTQQEEIARMKEWRSEWYGS